jgi:mannose-1-phosphate guanylyltransferase/mannose-6-phosphate isomerase
MVICNNDHRFLVADELALSNIQAQRIILEPLPRNTAPAVAAAALTALADDPDAVLVVLPSDHQIADEEAFIAAVERATAIARCGALVLFGIAPDAPNVGYGYIRRGKPLANGATGAFAVEAFVEKPDIAVATSFINQGNYFWNSGIFVLNAATYLAELERFEPVIAEACATAVARAVTDLDFVRLDREAFAQTPAISIDHAVMERTNTAPCFRSQSVGVMSALGDRCGRSANAMPTAMSARARLYSKIRATATCTPNERWCRRWVSIISLSSRRPMPSLLPTATARKMWADLWRGSNKAIIPSTPSTSATIDRGGISRRST